MGERLFQYDCEDCEKTVVTKEHPQQNEDDPLWCPSCSAVEIDYTVDPGGFDDPTIIDV